MSELCKNAVAFLQKRFPVAPVLNNESIFADADAKEIFRVWPMIALDSQSGIKQRAIAIENLGSRGELAVIAQSVDKIFSELDSSTYIKMGNILKPTGHEIDSNQMMFAPRCILYTNKLYAPVDRVIEAFNTVNMLIDIIDESEMHETLFISYGGPDVEVVAGINKKLKSKGVRTWFFPDDASPGDKLHRVMHDGVNNHDRVLLVCSKNSLNRSGVLNEIERVLEREAREGGSEILIPITLDHYVYSDWAPDRHDIANQIRARVITSFPTDGSLIDTSIEKLIGVLKK